MEYPVFKLGDTVHSFSTFLCVFRHSVHRKNVYKNTRMLKLTVFVGMRIGVDHFCEAKTEVSVFLVKYVAHLIFVALLSFDEAVNNISKHE